MKHTLFHLYGPLAIHSYGLMIAIGLLLFLVLIHKDRRFYALDLENRFSGILAIGIIAALLGGRLLFYFTHPEYFRQMSDFFAFYYGGFSILGAVLGVLITLPLYLRHLNIPIIPFLDLIALYAPFLQSISRIGCFLAGCCYGLPTSLPWGIIYTDTESVAPLYVCLHPTQLYSAIGLMIIFALMYFGLQHIYKKTGQLICWYLLLIGAERFIVEFWRGDRASSALFSLNQLVAAAMMGIALIGLAVIQHKSKK